MPTEAFRGIIRIGANYTRLTVTFLAGLFAVRILLGWLGAEAFGLIPLLGASIGIVALFRELTHRSMVRELGSAYHDEDPEVFAVTFSSAYVISTTAAVATLITFGTLLLILPLLNIPPDLLMAAQIFVVAQGTYAVALVFTSPSFNMYVVSERFIAYNLWYILLRLMQLVSAVVFSSIVPITDDPARGLIAFALLWSGLDILVLLTAVMIATLQDTRLVPRLSLIRKHAVLGVLKTFGWNSGVHIAMSMHERVGAIIMNAAIGLGANTLWGLAGQLAAWIRMATMGVQFGADAVSARISADRDNPDRLKQLVLNQTRLNSLVSVPLGLFVFVLTPQILHLWVGEQIVKIGPHAMFQAVWLARILTIAIICRSISDGWMTILYGAGFVRRYAPLVLLGGLLSPILALSILILPPNIGYYAPASAIVLVFLVIHLGMIPLVGRRAINMPALLFYRPLVPVVLVTAVAMLIPITASRSMTHWRVIDLGLIAGGFGLTYSLLAYRFLLAERERSRAHRAVRRRVGLLRESLFDSTHDL